MGFPGISTDGETVIIGDDIATIEEAERFTRDFSAALMDAKIHRSRNLTPEQLQAFRDLLNKISEEES